MNKIKKTTTTTTENTKETKKDKVVEKTRNKQLEKLVDDLNKKFGENALTVGFIKDKDGNIEIKRIPTGSFALDVALGGGIPEGRMTQISGAYSSTKTSQAIHILKQAQKLGYVCAFIDVEGTTTPNFLEELGVDTDILVYMNPDSMEEATEAILTLQKSKLVHFAVLDSIAALSTNKEMDTSMEDTVRIGIPQQLMGEFCRKYQMNNNRLKREKEKPFTLIVLNQLREKISTYGDPEYTPGGRAIGFTISVDIRFRRGDWITEGTGDSRSIVGQIVKFKVEKNKTFKRMQVGEFDFYFDENNSLIPKYYNDNLKEVIVCGVERGIIERAGAWFIYKDIKTQGLKNFVDTLRENKELVEQIKKEVLELVITRGIKND